MERRTDKNDYCSKNPNTTRLFTLTADLYSEYIKFCGGPKSRPVDFNIFGKKLAEKDILNRKRTIDGEQVRCYEGVIVGLPPESWRNEPSDK